MHIKPTNDEVKKKIILIMVPITFSDSGLDLFIIKRHY
jgi:hypothetical protein